jgi:hypothetical protein
MELPAASAPRAIMDKQEPILFGTGFLDKVKEGCSQNTFEASYWNDITILGKDTLAEKDLQEPSVKDTIVRITEITATMDGENWKSSCDEIVHLLAKEIKSR